MTATTSLRERLFDFLTRRYVQSQDARQREMGLQYMTAETHDLADSLAAALSTPPAGEWILVPREPTSEMMAAAHALPDYFDPGDEWRAMLAAAPEPATQEVG